MSITFKVFNDKCYFESKYTGIIDDNTILESYKKFFEGYNWNSSLNELVDLSESDLNALTSNGIIELQKYIENHYDKNNVTSLKTAFYVPNDLAYGLANIYAAYADESPENTMHFKNKSEAEKWLQCEE